LPSNGLDENNAMRHFAAVSVTASLADEFEKLTI
jgi:hypothetical protein